MLLQVLKKLMKFSLLCPHFSYFFFIRFHFKICTFVLLLVLKCFFHLWHVEELLGVDVLQNLWQIWHNGKPLFHVIPAVLSLNIWSQKEGRFKLSTH